MVDRSPCSKQSSKLPCLVCKLVWQDVLLAVARATRTVTGLRQREAAHVVAPDLILFNPLNRLHPGHSKFNVAPFFL